MKNNNIINRDELEKLLSKIKFNPEISKKTWNELDKINEGQSSEYNPFLHLEKNEYIQTAFENFIKIYHK